MANQNGTPLPPDYTSGMQRILAVLEETRPRAASDEPTSPDVETTLKTIHGLAFFTEVIAATGHRDRDLILAALQRSIRNECQAVLDDAMNRRAQAL